MKSNKLLLGSLLWLSISSIAVPTMAGEAGKNCVGKQHHAGKWNRDGFAGHEYGHAHKALALTDEQKQRLQAQRAADDSVREARHTKIAEARSALATAVESGANESELNALAEVVGKLHGEQALANAKARKAFLAVLTPEQKQSLAEAKAKRMERKIERREGRETSKS